MNRSLECLVMFFLKNIYLGLSYGVQAQQLWCLGLVVVVLKLSSCGAQAQLLHSMWDVLKQGSDPRPLHCKAGS